MKIKEGITEPGKVIHCRTEKQVKDLIDLLKEEGYVTSCMDHAWNAYGDQVCFRLWEDFDTKGVTYADLEFYENEEMEVTEMEDSPTDSPTDSPMTAVEVLEWIYDNAGTQRMREVFGLDRNGNVIDESTIFDRYSPEEIVDKIAAYKAEKKKAEIEEGYFCELYEKRDGADVALLGYSMWNTDKDTAIKDAQEKAKKYVIDTRKPCYTRVTYKCRVKEDEA